MLKLFMFSTLAIMSLPIPYQVEAANFTVRDGNGNFITKCAIQQSDGSLTDCTSDANNASYLFGASSSASNNTFTTAGRGLDALCTVAGTVTLTDTAGGTRSVQLTVGYQYFPFAVKSYTSLTGTCTLGVLL